MNSNSDFKHKTYFRQNMQMIPDEMFISHCQVLHVSIKQKHKSAGVGGGQAQRDLCHTRTC